MKALTNPISYTTAQRERLLRDWQNIANEGGLFTFGDGYITFMASELATLRLYKHYACDTTRISQGYSSNLNGYYFTLEF